MRTDRNTAFETMMVWSNPHIIEKVNEVEEIITSTLKMESTSDVYYEISKPDKRIDIFYVGINESYTITVDCFKDDEDASILRLLYQIRRPEMERAECEYFYDFRSDKYYPWSDETIPIEKRRNIVFDNPQWEFSYSNRLVRFSEYIKACEQSLEKAEMFKAILC